MHFLNKTRTLILGAAVIGATTVGAYAAAGDDGRTDRTTTTGRSTAAPAVPQAAGPKTTTTAEHGIVLEGTGSWRGQPVRVFVYENDRHGNSLQIVVGDPDGKHAIAAGEGRDAYVSDGVLNVGLDVDGDLAVVKGTVRESGAPRPATEQHPDGDLVKSQGTHTPLAVTATFDYRGETVALSFPKAFTFDLAATRAVTG